MTDSRGWSGKDLLDAVNSDEKEDFLMVIDWKFELFRTMPQQILYHVVSSAAVNCAEALLTGQTPLTVDLNSPCNGVYPIHLVALKLCIPSITELILCYGARTDVRFTPSNPGQEKFASMLPLEIALHELVVGQFLSKWTPKHSIYNLVMLLCLPRMQNYLETIGLLAGTTKETEELFLKYAIQEKIIEFTALLMVAHKKVYNVMDRVHKHFDSIEMNHLPIEEDQREKIVHMQQLIELFDKAGDAISRYMRKDKFEVSEHQTIVDVSCLLLEAGFHLQHSDLSDDIWNHLRVPKVWEASFWEPRCLNDFGMAHYSKSGYRWKVSIKDPWMRFFNLEAYVNELKNEVESLKEENVNIKKQQQQTNMQIWMDDELGKALEEDDKEEFFSVIDRKVDFFLSRQQQLLYIICFSGSIKCAEALLKGETPLRADMNRPCSNTGMYPLHCAALSLFPSITELFLYHGARTDIGFMPCNPSKFFPQDILEAHTNKLPLHMALQAISRLPCISEWTPKHSIFKLLTLLCLPRMQNPLETLSLLAGTTENIEDEFTELAIDGKIVELAALLMAAHEELYDVEDSVYERFMSIKDRPALTEDQRDEVESVILLLDVFRRMADCISRYMKEDKYDVTKNQTVEDVTCMLQKQRLPVDILDTDLSVYNWYHDEEHLYPSEAPYENVRLLHDVGMEHYAKSRFRWKVSKNSMNIWWRSAKTKAYIKELENDLERLKEENARVKKRRQQELKPSAFGNPYVFRRGVPIASCSFSHDAIKTEVENKMCGACLNAHNLMSTRAMSSMASSSHVWNLRSRRSMTSITLLLKQLMKHV